MGNAPSHFIDPNGESFQDAFMRANAGASENPNDWLKGSPGDLASRENFGSGYEDRFLGLYRNNGPGAGGGIGIDELALNAWNQAAFTYTKFRFNAYGKMYESIATNDLTEFLDTESGVTIVYNLSGRFKSVEGLNDMYDNVQGALNKFTLQSSASKGWDATNTTFGAFGLAIGAKITMLDGGAALNREMGISKVNKISMIRTYGAEGAKYMKYAKGLGVAGSLFTTGYSAYKVFEQFNLGGKKEVLRHRDVWDVSVGLAGLSATGFAYFGLISNPVGWGVGIGILIYGGATLIYDVVNND